jgi:hypothetical protein
MTVLLNKLQINKYIRSRCYVKKGQQTPVGDSSKELTTKYGMSKQGTTT